MRDFFSRLWFICNHIKILWKHWDDDYYSILVLLRFRLNRIRKLWEKDAIYANSNRIVHDLTVCDALLKRILDESYCELEFEKHERRWGRVLFTDDGMRRENAVCEADQEKSSKEIKRIFDHAEYLKKQDLHYLFTIFEKHLFEWWY